MNSVLHQNLSEILGKEQLIMFILKTKMVRNFLSMTLNNVQIGKSKDKQAFQHFKKLLKCTLLVSDNFMNYSNDFDRMYDHYKECLQQNLENFQKQENENLYLQLSNKLKIVFESMDLLNRLYHDAKKLENDNNTKTLFDNVAFQIPISA